MNAWPYPRWIAHRGAGKIAPENTLAAFRVGAAHGYRMIECDVKLSADGVPFLLHDATLKRTVRAWGTNESATAGDHPWARLAQMDAGAWHSRAYAGEPMPTLAAVACWCQANAVALNIEIKPTPGTDARTGTVVAEHAARLWAGAEVPPLLSSFQVDALVAAQQAAPDLPRGLLLDSLWQGWADQALALQAVAVICNWQLWTAPLVRQVHLLGARALSYTVNDEWAVQHLWALGTDGIITDRVDLFAPEN